MKCEVEEPLENRTGISRQSGSDVDFFIVGAPKCGTSSLYVYLREHPAVFMPDFKEPHYYAKDYHFPKQCKERGQYRALFAPAPDGALRGEASTWYLRSKVAIAEIMRDDPTATFIVMLRNPIDMIRSLHAHQYRRLYEDIEDLAVAWDAQEKRGAGRQIPRFCSDPKLLQYRRVCAFGEQLERLFSIAPRSQVLVHIFEEFVADPGAGYGRTLAFLGLPPDGRTEFPRVNKARDHHSRMLNRLGGHIQHHWAGPYRALKSAANRIGLRPGTWVTQFNKRPALKRALEPQFIAHLREELDPEIERVEYVLGRRIEAWHSHA